MSIQDILRILGVVFLAAAAALAVAAAYTYRALDIRGVKDDLAGRRREAPSANEAKLRAHRRSGEKAMAEPAKATTGPVNRVADSPESVGSPSGQAVTPPSKKPMPPAGAAAPASQFRVTRKEIVVASEKTIEE